MRKFVDFLVFLSVLVASGCYQKKSAEIIAKYPKPVSGSSRILSGGESEKYVPIQEKETFHKFDHHASESGSEVKTTDSVPSRSKEEPMHIPVFSKTEPQSAPKYIETVKDISRSSNANVTSQTTTGTSKIYTAQKGDTYYSIARKFAVNPRELMQLNKVSFAAKNTHIKSGDSIKIPGNSVKTPAIQIPKQHETLESAKNTSKHIVTKGDTLYSIARKYGTTVAELSELNQITTRHEVKIGEAIDLPTSPVLKTASSKENNSHKNEVKNLSSTDKPIIAKGAPEVTSESPKCELAFVQPTDFSAILIPYGKDKNGIKNEGVDLKVQNGSTVVASEKGVVVYSGNDIKEYGNLIIIKHQSSWFSIYGNLDKFLVKKGDAVKKADKIAISGRSGKGIREPQLFFAIRKLKTTHDPMECLGLK